MFYKQRVLANFWGRKDSAICASRKRSGACYCAVHMNLAINKFVYADHAVFSTLKVCWEALVIKHKYAQDDYNWLN